MSSSSKQRPTSTAITLHARDNNDLSELSRPDSDVEVYSTKLNDTERMWGSRYAFFLEHGYQLRSRYRPGWRPSWIGTSLNPSYCEDAIEQLIPTVMDAMTKDGAVVCLKMVQKNTEEVEIAQYLSSDWLLRDSKNHSVPILASFRDPFVPEIDYIVMPVLRPFDDPEFWVVGEIVDFVTQILEGLVFMHSHDVAHRDCTGANIMMDGRPIYPNGWHFVRDQFSADGVHLLTPLTRIDHPVRYYFVDYGMSVRFLPGQKHEKKGLGGRDQEVPELSDTVAYDPFKMDVFTVGNLFLKDFYQKYLGLHFLSNLINNMMTRDPHLRPTAQLALQQWYKIKASLSVDIARWRLRRPAESVGERVILDTVAVARQSIHSFKIMFSDSPRTWSNP